MCAPYFFPNLSPFVFCLVIMEQLHNRDFTLSAQPLASG